MPTLTLTPLSSQAEELEDLRRQLFLTSKQLVQVAYARDAALARVNSLERDLYATQAAWRATAQEAAEFQSRALRAEQALAEATLELTVVAEASHARA